jgi:hypothetical protein
MHTAEEPAGLVCANRDQAEREWAEALADLLECGAVGQVGIG